MPVTAGAEFGGAAFAVIGRLLGARSGTGDGADDDGGRDLDGAVVVQGRTITAVQIPARLEGLPPRRVRAAFVAPGFIDLQINGAFGFEVGTDPAALHALAARLPATGVTAFLPTLVSRGAADYDLAFAAFDTFAGAAEATDATGAEAPARALGLHLEGPLLAAARRGAHARPPIEQADAALVERLADPRRVRVVTLAPERDGVPALVARLSARGIVVALGHTDASFEAFTAAVDAGATLATHVFNAMSPLHHRAPGATGAALTDDRVTALMIADGVHTHPAAFKLAVRAKGGGRLALVTDATPGAGLGPGVSHLGSQSVVIDQTSARLPDGTLAGSTLTMDRAIRNAVAFAGLTAGQAVRLATAVPARVLGLGDRGSLFAGARADLVLLDEALNVTATYVGGGLAYAGAGAGGP